MSFFQRIDPREIPGNILREEILLIFRERILQYILIGMSALGSLAYAASLVTSIQRGMWTLLILYTLAYGAILGVTYFRQISFTLRAGSLLFVLYALGLSGLLESGLSGDGRIFLIVFSVMAAVLLGLSRGIAAGILSAVTLVVTGSGMSSGIIPTPAVEVMANSGKVADWITGSIVFITLAAVTIMSIVLLTKSLEQTVEKERKLTEDLRSERNKLEGWVDERTKALERRRVEKDVASRLARDIASTSNLEELLNRSTDTICTMFGFYHVGIFLMDEKNEYAVLKAATGNAGRVMVERGHRLPAGEVGIVGHAVSQGEVRITDDTLKESLHYKNPLLPETRAELAIPLKLGDRVIGALDVQSETPGIFGSQDISILQIMADQLAVAIEKARLVEQLRSNLQEVQAKAENQAQETWRTHLRETHQGRSYYFRNDGSISAQAESLEARQAFESGEVVVGRPMSTAGAGERERAVAVPIRLRQQVIGVLDVHFEEDALTQDRVEILKTTANRMALALENARLMEMIQLRAEQEHMVSEISAKVRSSSDIDSILRTAAAELGRSLGISEVTVQLRPEN